jgi:hypothetical protein
MGQEVNILLAKFSLTIFSSGTEPKQSMQEFINQLHAVVDEWFETMKDTPSTEWYHWNTHRSTKGFFVRKTQHLAGVVEVATFV